MQEYNLIGINMESVSTSVNYFAETGIFQTIPMIVYTINDNRTKEFHIERPIKLFYKNMSYKDFESIVKTDGTGLDFMAMPGKAYQRMQYYINRNVEKVLADMFVSIIVEILKELKEEKENIFFINNRESDKVIGRLGYMYLSSEKNTFSFVTYKPDNLMTNSMRNGSDVLEFDIEYFPVYLLSGQLIFNFFSESTTNAMSAIIANGPLIKKIYVPKYLFVLSRVFSSTINLLASFTAMICVMLAMRIELHYTVFLVILPLFFIVVFSLGVGLVLSAITVKFRDIMHLYSVFVTALMYLTPVIYPMSILPDWLRPIVLYNPITNILLMFRGVMLYNSLPSVSSIVIAVIECIVMLALGLYVFYKNQDDFILNI